MEIFSSFSGLLRIHQLKTKMWKRIALEFLSVCTSNHRRNNLVYKMHKFNENNFVHFDFIEELHNSSMSLKVTCMHSYVLVKYVPVSNSSQGPRLLLSRSSRLTNWQEASSLEMDVISQLTLQLRNNPNISCCYRYKLGKGTFLELCCIFGLWLLKIGLD